MQSQWLMLGGVALALQGLGVVGLLYRAAPAKAAGRAVDALCLGAAASPLVLGVVTVAMMAVLGAASDLQYVVASIGLGAALVLLSMRSLRDLAREVRADGAAAMAAFRWRNLPGVESALVILMLLAAALPAARVLSGPMFDNDPLEYAIVGRALYEQRTIAAYPLVEPDPRSGMYAPTTHPPMFVALIFLGNVLQGGAAVPGPMRWIGPLCLVLAALVLMRLARREVGWAGAMFTGLLVLSTPLLVFRASAGAIDLLPVLGMSVTLAAIGMTSTHPLPARIAVVGAALSLSLWTHSEAVLFPIVIVAAIAVMRVTAGTNRSDRFEWVKEAVGVAVVAAAIGAGPYLRNLWAFGAAISDAPPVVRVPSLDWAGYFTHARGLSTTYEQIVLGVLRGWTDPLFGALFWVMTAGLLAAAVQRRRGRPTAMGAIVCGALASALVYELLMLASVAAGSYEMIKNPRYTLPMVPAVAVAGGFALAPLTAGGPGRRALRRLLALAIAVVSSWPMLVQLPLHARAAVAALKMPVSNEDPRLMAYAPYRLQRVMRDTLPDTATVLAFQPALMYYGRHRMVSFLDPRLIPAYVERDPAAAAATLKEIGVTHLLRPPYSLPAIADSAMAQLMADARLVRLVKSDEHYTLFELIDGSATGLPARRTWDFSPSRIAWSGTGHAFVPVIGPLCPGTITVSTSAAQPTIRGCGWLPRHRATYLIGSATAAPGPEPIAITPGSQYRYAARLSGRGFATIVVEEQLAHGRTIRVIDGAVVSSQPRELTRWLRFDDGVTAVRFGITMEGNSAVAINGFTVDEIPQ